MFFNIVVRKILQYSLVSTSVAVFFYKSLTLTLLKKDSNTDTFLWILQNL